MLISKFNRMIRSKILWGAFAVLISVSFIGVGSMSSKSGCRNENENALTTVLGRPVNSADIFKARLYELGLRQTQPLSTEQNAALDDAALKRIATLAIADKLGIHSAPEEIASIKGQNHAFLENGVFNETLYHTTIQREYGVNPHVFEEWLGEQVVLSKMRFLASAFTWTSPDEISAKLANLTDMFTVECIYVTNTTAKISVKKEQAIGYFEKNKEAFKIPEQRIVSYFSFPFADFEQTAELSTNVVLRYYETHEEEFSFRDTDDKWQILPFDEVQESIQAKLAKNAAHAAARDRATEISLLMIPDRTGHSMSPEEIAEKEKITIMTTEPFSLTNTPANISAGMSFNKAAFALVSSDPERRVSDPITGSNACYIAIADKILKPRIPDFVEVEKEVFAAAEAAAKVEKIRQEAIDLQKKTLETAQKGDDLNKLSALKNRIVTAGPFSVFTDITNDVQYTEHIITQTITMNEGDVSDLIEIPEGYMFIHLCERQMGDPISAESYRGELINALASYRGAAVLEDWQATLLTGSAPLPSALAKKEKRTPDDILPDEED